MPSDPAAAADSPVTDLPAPPPALDRSRLWEVARLFTRLGFTAFGGPAVHTAMMEDEVVRRRRWVDREHFLDLVSALNFIPGPNSTELAIHLGLIRAGFPGLVVAGACFIGPAVLIILPLAWAYVRFGTVPQVLGMLDAVSAATVAILAIAAWRFAKTAVKDRFTACVAVAALGAAFLLDGRTPWQPELVILAAVAVAGAVYYGRRRGGDGGGGGGGNGGKARPGGRGAGGGNAGGSDGGGEGDAGAGSNGGNRANGGAAEGIGGGRGNAAGGDGRGSKTLPLLGVLPLAQIAASAAAAGAAPRMASVFLLFLKIGGTLFGSGYVLVSYLRTELVERRGWLTDPQLLDAVAVGQVTPGPLLTTATFIGYVLGDRTLGGAAGGVAGGLVATAGIFLPSFVLVALLGPVLPRLRRNRVARGALDATNAAVAALLVAVTLELALRTFGNPLRGDVRLVPIALCAAAAVALGRWDVNSTWVIAAAAAIGAAQHLLLPG